MDQIISTEVEDRTSAITKEAVVVTQVISAETRTMVDKILGAIMVLRTMDQLTTVVVILIRISVMACRDSTHRGQ